MKKKKAENKGLRSGVTWAVNNLSYILFLAVLGLFYISNAHSAEKKMRNIESLKKEVKSAKNEYMKVKEGIMFPCTESELAKQLNESGLKVNKEKPIVLNTKSS